MPTIDDALQLARDYAAADSRRTGRQWRAFVEEFEYGWAIWTAMPEGEVPPIGTGNKSVLDRETGHISHWPAWSTETLAQTYAANRHLVHTENQRLARANVQLPAAPEAFSGLGVHATLTYSDGRTWRQSSALADDLPDHHPLVAQWFADQPRGNLVRGVERHCVMWLISDALHDLEPEQLGRCHLRSPMPCATCVTASVHFGITNPVILAAFAPRLGDLQPGSGTLRDGTAFDPATWAEIAFSMLEEEQAASPPIPRVEAARPILERFPVAISERRGPGRETYVQPFHLGITEQIRKFGDDLARFGALIGAAVFPVGEIDRRGLIAVDAHGRLFVLDEGGAWYCGRDIDTALHMLLEGLQMPRIRSDGSVSY